jgi:hypothetical protein
MTSNTPQPATGRWSRRETLWVTLFFVLLTAIMTWPQVTVLATHAREHQDIYFNLWRLHWVAHALATAPADLFNGNIFHPEPRTLALSDAMVVEGVIAAPLIWVGLPPLLVHNLLLLGAIVGSGVGMFVLARDLTGCRGAALAAGVIFSFVPYRFEHYMHMELQWIVWTPWAFRSLHQTYLTGSLRHGLLTGIFVVLQMLSSIYYGIFLATFLGVCALCLVAAAHGRRLRVLRALAAGGAVAAIVSALYGLPYLASKQTFGGRSDTEIITFSARPSSYLVATPDNVVWGRAFASRGRPERRLFPGAVVLLLAVAGLLLRPPPLIAVVYLIAAVCAFELSLGFSGYTFRFLYDHVPLFHGLRAISRAGIFVAFFLAALAAFGFTTIASGLERRWRIAFAVAVLAALVAEYRVQRLTLFPYPNEPPAVYAWLSRQPTGVVAELPMPLPEALPGEDPQYAYYSTFHWNPLLNGYSGFYPASYLDRLETLRQFPDDASVSRLHRDGTRYLILHAGRYPEQQRASILETLTNRHRMAELARFGEGNDLAIVFLVH